jgi:hypothetical protein
MPNTWNSITDVLLIYGSLGWFKPMGLNNGCMQFATIQFRILSSHLLSKNLKIKIYKTIILPVFCMVVKLDLSHYRKNTD